jgi:hypothetical protein
LAQKPFAKRERKGYREITMRELIAIVALAAIGCGGSDFSSASEPNASAGTGGTGGSYVMLAGASGANATAHGGGGAGGQDPVASPLSATIIESDVSIASGALGSSLSGGFKLQFALDADASGSTKVGAQSFSLNDSSGQPLIQNMPTQTDGLGVPLTLDRGDTKIVTFVINSSSVLAASVREKICAGTLTVSGTISDSISGTTFTVESEPFAASCE